MVVSYPSPVHRLNSKTPLFMAAFFLDTADFDPVRAFPVPIEPMSLHFYSRISFLLSDRSERRSREFCRCRIGFDEISKNLSSESLRTVSHALRVKIRKL